VDISNSSDLKDPYDGLKVIKITALEAAVLERERRPDNLSGQAMNVPSTEESLSREDTLRSFKELTTTVSQMELDAITEIVENLHRDAEMTDPASDAPLLALSLELKVGKGAGAHLIPVTLKNLSSEMLALEANSFEGIRNPETLQGKKAILRLTDPKSQESMNINAVMTWTQPKTDQKINIILKILNAQSHRPASKISENSPLATSKETQWFWNLWDETKLTKEYVDQRDNFLLLCLACGTIGSSFIDPKTFQTMQYLLSVIGLGNVIKFLRER
jgi:hypothetical protein